MRPHFNVRFHTHKINITAVILTWANAVEQFIVFCHQRFSAFRITPNPISESILDGLLFLLSKGGFLFIENTLLLSFCILNDVVNPGVFQIQRILQNPIGIGTIRAIGRGRGSDGRDPRQPCGQLR